MKKIRRVYPCSPGGSVPIPRLAGTTALGDAWQYEIRLAGHLDDHWSDWLGGLAIIRIGQGHTILRGLVLDQAALYGILARIRDLGLPLIALKRVVSEPTDDGATSAGVEP